MKTPYERFPRRARSLHAFRPSLLILLTAVCTMLPAIAQGQEPSAPAPQDVLTAEILSGPRRVYVGQPLPLTLRVTVAAPTLGGQTFTPDFVLRLLDTTKLGPFDSQPASVNNDVDADGRQTYAFDFPARVVPSRAAPITINDITLHLRYPSDAGTREIVARPAPVTLTVLPVPAENRPPHFTGAVGIVSIQVTATPTQVRVGDPIDLTIDVFGDADVASLPPPALDELAADFRLPDAPLSGQLVDGRRRFTARIRARSASARQVPAIEYAYFDPYAESFHVARSAPVLLDVRPAATATPTTATAAEDGSDNPESTFTSRLKPENLTPADLLVGAFILRPHHVWLALAIPPLFFAGAVFVLLRHHRRIRRAVVAGALICAVLPVVRAMSPATSREALAREALETLSAAQNAAARFDVQAQATQLRAAAAQLEALEATGVQNATLEHLLGAAYLDLGEPAPAILHLRRASALAPFEVGIARDLHAARARIAPATTPPAPFEQQLGPDAKSMLAFYGVLLASLIGWGMVASWVLRRKRKSLVLGVLLVAAAVGLAAYEFGTLASLARRPPAVVITETALRTQRGPDAETVGKAPLVPGVELRELEDRAGWSRVRLPGGETGWLPAAALARI